MLTKTTNQQAVVTACFQQSKIQKPCSHVCMGSLHHGDIWLAGTAVTPAATATNFDLYPHELDGLLCEWTCDGQLCSTEQAPSDDRVRRQKLDWRCWKNLDVGPILGVGGGHLLDACLQGGSAHGETRFMKTQVAVGYPMGYPIGYP